MSHALYQYDEEHCPLSVVHSAYKTFYELLLTRAGGDLLLQTPIQFLILQDLWQLQQEGKGEMSLIKCRNRIEVLGSVHIPPHPFHFSGLDKGQRVTFTVVPIYS
jgi:hypothetical protein